MNKTIPRIIISTLLLCGVVITWSVLTHSPNEDIQNSKPTKVRSSHSPKAASRAAEGRKDFFFNALRDPALNQIPGNARLKELELYHSIKNFHLKSAQASMYTWAEAGPNDVGGRTRALAIDVRNSNVIIAGGVSGGIWKSTDNGESWSLKNTPEETLSVTSICQDTRPGHEDTWYYSSGEFDGNSARASGASYYGHGLYKSIDNGETWTMIFGNNSNPYIYDKVYDYVSKIKVNPSNGQLYIAANGYGLIQTINDAGTLGLKTVIGASNDHFYCDFDFDSEGNVLCVLSEFSYNKSVRKPSQEPKNKPGIYYSIKGTDVYTQIDATSTTFPTTHERSLIRFAPSNSEIGYVFTHKGDNAVSFHKIDVKDKKLIDRTAFLPQSIDNDNGVLGKQGNYNMTLAVKPDDPNFVIAGSVSLFRSKDGFESVPEFYDGWIGGYRASKKGSNSSYFNHHADCHITVFDPNNSNAVWSGHDGGLSYVTDITAATSEKTVMPWQDKNNGYNVTQYYTIADIAKANDNRYLGGTQDNGSPAFTWDGATTGPSTDVSSGDGSYCYMGQNYAYISTQNGKILRIGYGANGLPLSPYSQDGPWTSIDPADATGQLFINPFAVDNNDENIMYYAAGGQVWINRELGSIPNGQNETMQGWIAPNVLLSEGMTVTAISVSQTPGHILYYGAYSGNAKPKIFKVKNSHYDHELLVREDISVEAAPSGAYPYYISVNPANADEIIVVFSNYGIQSAYHSTDGGATYTNIDGNLAATAENPGPSFRSAAIQNWEGQKTYYVSTSIGTYKTTALNGASTNWQVIAKDKLGNVVCNRVKTSDLDGKVIIATHGRGLFVGQSQNPLFVANKLANVTRFIGSANETIDISQLFGHSSDGTYEVSLKTNSNDGIVTTTLSGQSLTFDFSNTKTGVSLITLKATSGADIVESTFSVTVKSQDDTAVEELPEEKSHDQEFKIYPNPSDGVFYLDVRNFNKENCKVSIYNTQGRLIRLKEFNSPTELNNNPFNLSDEAPGIYIVQFQIQEQTITKKIRLK